MLTASNNVLRVDMDTAWLLLLTIATPVAGVVGFALQLRQVKKARLENAKLQLEIALLKEQIAAADRRIVRATPDEIQRVTGRTAFSRWRTRDMAHNSRPVLQTSLQDKVFAILVLAGAAVVLAYLVFDLYRLAVWAFAVLRWT